jgi:integrase
VQAHGLQQGQDACGEQGRGREVRHAGEVRGLTQEEGLRPEKRGRRRGSGRLWKRDEMWVLDYYDEHGVRHQPHLGKNKREAEGLRSEIISRRNRILLGLDEAPKDIALDDLRCRYLADLAARTTPRHVLNVRLQLARMLPSFEARTVDELTPSQFLAYRAKLLEPGLSNRCANVHLQAIKGMLKWALDNELISRNPLANVKKLPDGKKHQKRQRRALSNAEVERFLNAAVEYDRVWGTDKQRIPQAPMWRALVDTGARYGEMRQLVWEDLDVEAAVLIYRAEVTKAGQAREVPIQADFLDELVELRRIHWRVLGRRPGQAAPIFLTPTGVNLSASTNNPRRMFNKVLERAGIEPLDELGKKIDIHALRHSFVTRLQRAGVSLGHAQKLAGHSDPKLTASIYTHLERDDLRKAIDALPARSTSERKTGTGT